VSANGLPDARLRGSPGIKAIPEGKYTNLDTMILISDYLFSVSLVIFHEKQVEIERSAR
jgi:hypothetical protein